MNAKENRTTRSIFPKGEKATQNFTGTAWVKTLVANDDTLTTIIAMLCLKPVQEIIGIRILPVKFLFARKVQGITRKRVSPFKQLMQVLL